MKDRKFSLENLHVTDGYVTKIYDGDTFTIRFSIVKLFYPRTLKRRPRLRRRFTFTWKCRLAGIDTPELRSKDPDLKALAYLARDEARKRYLHKRVSFKCLEFDKYGRVLIEDVRREGDEECASEWLVNNKYAVLYNGRSPVKRIWPLTPSPSLMSLLLESRVIVSPTEDELVVQ